MFNPKPAPPIDRIDTPSADEISEDELDIPAFIRKENEVTTTDT